MNSRKKLLLGALALVLVLGAGAALYNRLAPTLDPQLLHTAAPEETASDPQGSESPQPIPAPDFTVTDANGSPVSLSDLTGGLPVVLNFWTSKCGPCRTEMPHFEQAHQLYGDQVRFVMVDAVGFMGESEQSGRDYVAQEGYTLPVYYDLEQSATLTYGIRAFPTTFFLDGEGNVVAYAESMLTEEALMTGLEMLVPGLSGDGEPDV